MNNFKTPFLLLLLCGTAYAESKVEADLRARLAASEAAHAAAMRQTVDLTAALAKLTQQGAAHARQATLQRSGASDAASANAASASDTAAANAASAQATAQANAVIAQQSATSAAAAALAAQQATEHSNTALLITQVSGFLAVLAGFLYKGWTEARDHRWAQEEADPAWRFTRRSSLMRSPT